MGSLAYNDMLDAVLYQCGRELRGPRRAAQEELAPLQNALKIRIVAEANPVQEVLQQLSGRGGHVDVPSGLRGAHPEDHGALRAEV